MVLGENVNITLQITVVKQRIYKYLKIERIGAKLSLPLSSSIEQ